MTMEVGKDLVGVKENNVNNGHNSCSYSKGHSRNPSAAISFIAPPPNKPNAVDSLLKIIGVRGADFKTSQQKINGARILSTFHF